MSSYTLKINKSSTWLLWSLLVIFGIVGTPIVIVFLFSGSIIAQVFILVWVALAIRNIGYLV